MNRLALTVRLAAASEARAQAIAADSRGDAVPAERLHQIADGHDRAADRILRGEDSWPMKVVRVELEQPWLAAPKDPA